MNRKFSFTLLILLFLSWVFFDRITKVSAQTIMDNTDASLYWGALIKGRDYGVSYSDPPWDLNTWNLFESNVGKKVSILHWGQPWYWSTSWPYGYYPFDANVFTTTRNRGAIPLLDWGSWDLTAGGSTSQPNFSLSSIISGNHDSYITQWATGAKNWEHPFFLRFDWEMNGDWYPWSEKKNGNSSGQFIQAWRHIHDIFVGVGATNVSWVWCPNTSYVGSIPMSQLYPGDSYVDWTCLDIYNKDAAGNWFTFSEVIGPSRYNGYQDSYKEITAVAPNKPLMLGEIGSLEAGDGGTKKATWITNALTQEIPNNFPKIKAVVWFNWNSDTGSSYVIESSLASQQAFARVISSSVYSADNFANLNGSPIPPLTIISTNTPTPTVSPNPDCSEIRSSVAPDWCDGFNGNSIDTNKWNNTNFGCWDTWDKTKAANVTEVSGGQIHLKLSEGGQPTTCSLSKPYTGFGFESYGKHDLGYGCWETRTRFSTTGDKRVTGYIALYPESGWPPEIDFVETSGRPGDSNKVFFTQHWGVDNSGSHPSQGDNISFDITQFHTYAVEITSSQIKWYVDGNLKTTQVNNSPGTKWHLTQGLWACGWENHGSTCDGIVTPQYMDIDYFTIWDNKTCSSIRPEPSPSMSPTPTVVLCTRKGEGDADCNGTINILDFEVWRREFLGIDTTTKADFDSSGGVTILDFEIWRRGFLGQ